MKTYILQKVDIDNDMSYPFTFRRLFNSIDGIIEFISNDSSDDVDDEQTKKIIASGGRVYAGKSMYSAQEVEPNTDMMKDLVWLCKELVNYAKDNNLDFVSKTIDSIEDFIDKNEL